MFEDEYWDGTGVTPASLRAKIEEIAERETEFVYCSPTGTSGMCFYTYGGQPGCIVGKGVYEITGKLVDQNAYGGVVSSSKWTKALGAPVDEFDGELGFHPDSQEYKDILFLRSVQSKQDRDISWGVALIQARTEEAARESEEI